MSVLDGQSHATEDGALVWHRGTSGLTAHTFSVGNAPRLQAPGRVAVFTPTSATVEVALDGHPVRAVVSGPQIRAERTDREAKTPARRLVAEYQWTGRGAAKAPAWLVELVESVAKAERQRQ